MSAGSDASNGGYGGVPPNSNINGSFVNTTNSNYAGGFSSNEIPGLPGLVGAKWNVNAANSIIGGGKQLKRKIKNITKKYKMKCGKSFKKKVSSLKRRLKSKYRKTSKSSSKSKKHRRTRRKKQMGGYSQYQNNMPLTQNYSIGGVLSAANLGLANPPPYHVLPNCTDCVDNYNHLTGMGFSSRGH